MSPWADGDRLNSTNLNSKVPSWVATGVGDLNASASTFSGRVTIAQTGLSGVPSNQPLEVVGITDSGIAITAPGTTIGDEAYIAGFMKDSSGVYQKIGAHAFLWANRSTSTGFASWNVHVSYMSAGVQVDDFAFVSWGSHGAAFFPTSAAAALAPGACQLQIHGDLVDVRTIRSLGSIYVGTLNDATLSAAGVYRNGRLTIGASAGASIDIYTGTTSKISITDTGVAFGVPISSGTTGQSGSTSRVSAQGELVFSVLSLTSNGAEFGFRSGNTVYRFFSDAVG